MQNSILKNKLENATEVVISPLAAYCNGFTANYVGTKGEGNDTLFQFVDQENNCWEVTSDEIDEIISDDETNESFNVNNYTQKELLMMEFAGHFIHATEVQMEAAMQEVSFGMTTAEAVTEVLATFKNDTEPFKSVSTFERDDFMAFFRSDTFHESVSVDDAKEVFRTVLHGSSDITKELLTETASDYEVNVLRLFTVKELMDEIARRAIEEGIIESASSLSLMTSEKAQWGVKAQLHKCNGVDIGNENYYVDPQEYVGESDLSDLVEKAKTFGISLINVY